MVRSGAEVADLLRAIAASGDDWLRVWETEDGRFHVCDPAGSVATVEIEAHWVEVRAGRSIYDATWPIGTGSQPARSLLRIRVSNESPPILTVCGRVYLDGFSLHALMCTARDVLTLAGPLPSEAESPPAAPTFEPASEEIEVPPDRGPHVETAGVEPAGAGPVPAQPSFPIAEATVISPEPVASLPIEAAITPVAGSAPSEAPAVKPDEGEISDAAPAPDAEVEPGVHATPIMPTWSSSVGATVQIPRTPPPESVTPQSEDAPAEDEDTPAVCRRCGAEVQPGERFCINCGAPQEAPPPSSVQQTVARRTEPDTVVWRRPQPGDEPCARCGVVNPERNRYCQGCGATLRDR